MYAVWSSLAPAVKADVVRDSQWEALEQQYQPAAPGLFNASTDDSRETSVIVGPAPTAADSRETFPVHVPRFRRGVRSPGMH